MSQPPTYRETVAVPWYWWALGAGFAFSIFLAALRFFTPAIGLAGAVVTMLLIGLGLVAYSRTVIRVDTQGLWVGRGVLEWEWLGSATALSTEATRDRTGPGADARAWLFLRPFLDRGVEVAVVDPADRHPYWLVATRHPERLARAIEAARPARGGDSG